MKRNPFNTMLRQEKQIDIESEGLGSRLDQFLKDNRMGDYAEPGAADPGLANPPPAGDSRPPQQGEEAPPKPDETKPAEQATPGATPPDDDDDDELPIPGAARAPKPEPKELDYDAQTEAIVKAIEAKGHPGDEYRRLRSELKELKSKQSGPVDLEKIPEVQDLKQKAAEAERLRLEAEALRERNKELLRINDEVEIMESDEYIAAVKAPIKEINSIVKQIAEGAKLDPESIFAVIRETDIVRQDAALEAMRAKLGNRMAGRIERFCDDYKAIQAKAADMFTNHKSKAEQARLERVRSQQEEITRKVELFRNSVDESFRSYAKLVPGFADSSGAMSDIAIAAAEKAKSFDVNTLAPEDLGYMLFATHALPEIRREVKELKKQLALAKAGRPAPSGPDAGSASPPRQAPDDDSMGLAERMRGMEFTFTPPS